jgi:hypothetical protein
MALSVIFDFTIALRVIDDGLASSGQPRLNQPPSFALQHKRLT